MDQRIFEHITNDGMIGIAVFEKNTLGCLYLNRLARETLEVGFNDPVDNLRVENLFTETPRENMHPFTKETLKDDGTFQDMIMKKSNSNIFVADVNIKHFKFDDLHCIVLMFRDVTYQKKLQREVTSKQNEIQTALQELMDQNRALLDLDRAKDKFIALTSHELRTPLSAMVATSEVLALKLYDSDEQRDEFIQTIHQEGQHLLAIVNDILDFSKIQAGKMDLYIEHKSPLEMTQRIVEHFKQMGEVRGVQIQLETSSLSRLECYFDPLRLSQVFSNVLSNAVKFTNDQSKVTVRLNSTDTYIVIGVKDQGPGIPPEYQEKVFNEFETLGNVITHHKGTGLGMPISKKLIERMGGKIYLQSELGNGTEFFIEIPRQRVLADEDYRIRPELSDDLMAS